MTHRMSQRFIKNALSKALEPGHTYNMLLQNNFLSSVKLEVARFMKGL